MKKFLRKIPKHYWLIGLFSVIQPLYTWGRLAIGGDAMIPFSADVLEKYLFQWQPIQNGLYFSLNYLPLFLYYSVVDFFGLSAYQASFLLLFGINFLAGIGLYKLLSLLHQEEGTVPYGIPMLLYLFSPALLNGWHYMYLYAVLPWFFYLLFGVIRKKELSLLDTLLFTIVIFFSSLDLPNPKYLFYLFVAAGVIFAVSFLLGMVRLSFFFRNAWKLALILFMNLYLFLPLLYFASHYSSETYSVHTQTGYKDSGPMMDYGSATLDRMYRLYHDGININSHEKKAYLSSWAVALASYFFILSAVAVFLLKKNSLRDNQQQIIFLSLILVFLLFAAGPNPPFGSLYEFVVRNFSLFAFLRTTAGAVFFLALFYAVMVSFLLKRRDIRIAFLTLAMIFIASYPIFNGDFYKNNNSTGAHVNAKERGVRMPEEYFEMKRMLDTKLIDTKILIPKMNASYMSAEWGYFGPILYNFLYTGSFLSVEKVYTNIYAHGVRYILDDASLINSKNNPEFQNPADSTEVASAGDLALSAVPERDFLPHFFVPERASLIDELSENPLRNEAGPEDALFVRDQLEKSALESLEDRVGASFQRPFLEFKEINQTKYRVRIHQAKGLFPLVFSENFDRGWRVYAGEGHAVKKAEKPVSVDGYKILEGNNEDQASKEELLDYIDAGRVTSLGAGNPKTRIHNSWEGGRKRFDHKEEYNISFVSKSFHDVIQNDNLPNGSWEDGWSAEPLIQEEEHVRVNGYANSWFLDVQEICEKKDGFCRKNDDGTYDFEVIVEFWPQRLYMASLLLSGAMIGLVIGIVALNRHKKASKRDGIIPLEKSDI